MVREVTTTTTSATGEDYPVAYVRWTENRNMTEFMRLASTGAVDTNALVSHRFDLDAAPQAYATIMTAGTDSLAVLLKYGRRRPAHTNHAVTQASRQSPGSHRHTFGSDARWTGWRGQHRAVGTHAGIAKVVKRHASRRMRIKRFALQELCNTGSRLNTQPPISMSC